MDNKAIIKLPDTNPKTPIRVLVVDDNAILLRTVKEMLCDKFTVSIAASSSQAFTSISKNIPDIILLDYEMPYENGEVILQKLRNNAESKDIPVVFFTGSADREVVTKLVSLNPAGYLLKPPNRQKMIDKILKTLTPPETESANDEEVKDNKT